MTAHTHNSKDSVRTPVVWGLVFGGITLAAPLARWYLDQATVLALSIVLIAAVYIGFAIADGRPKVIVVETCVASVFVAAALMAEIAAGVPFR